jgi:hypothetical protein
MIMLVLYIYIYIYLLDLSSTYVRKHAAFDFLSLAYFTEHDVLQFHQFTFKQHIAIIPYDWIKFHCVYIYDIFLIRSSVVGHLGCFQSMTIVNSAVINISKQVSLLYPDLQSFG